MIVTDQTVELYQIEKQRQQKKLEIYNVNVKWYIYNARNKILVVASGKQENVLQGFCFKQNFVFKLPKLEIPLKREILKKNHFYINQM